MTMDSPTISRFAVRMLAWFTFLTGIASIVLGCTWLPSEDWFQLLVGTIEWLAGIGVGAIGWLILIAPSRFPHINYPIQALGCLRAFVPALIAYLSWPIIFLTGGIVVMLVMPLVILTCIIFAKHRSFEAVTHLMQLTGWQHPRRSRALLFTIQVLAILASWPAFGHFLQLLEWMGLLRTPFSA
jgi:hypothetical protein